MFPAESVSPGFVQPVPNSGPPVPAHAVVNELVVYVVTKELHVPAPGLTLQMVTVVEVGTPLMSRAMGAMRLCPNSGEINKKMAARYLTLSVRKHDSLVFIYSRGFLFADPVARRACCEHGNGAEFQNGNSPSAGS